MPIIQLTDCISYLPASEKPLSCDIVFVKTNKATWIYDVGVNSEAADEINKVEGTKNIVISHFHPDHVFNLARVKYDNLYVSKNTKKYVFRGNVIQGKLDFEEEPGISVIELPSSHAKGCLCLVCGDYAFLGDGAYCKPVRGHHTYNTQLLLEMIKTMESLDVRYFCLSHDEHFVQPKPAVIRLYKDIYARRTPDSPIISVEDYF